MIYNVKIEGFRHKARHVAGCHMTTALSIVTYASGVLHESVQIAITLAALSNLEVKCGDVLNAYITAPVKEKVWTFLGPEHGKDADKQAIIVQALCELNSSGAAFRAHCAGVQVVSD